MSRHISATTLLGVPAEIYKYGTQYWVCAISGIVVKFQEISKEKLD